MIASPGPVRDGVCSGGASGKARPEPLGGNDPHLRRSAPDFSDGGPGGAAGAFAAAPGAPVRRGHRQSGTPAHCRESGSA